jgi:hypothetical protein
LAASSTAARISASVNSGAPGTGRDDLDDVGAAVEDEPNALAHLVRRVRHPEAELAREHDVARDAGDLTAPARDGDIRAGNGHARADRRAIVDGVAKGHVHECAVGADVPHGGESGQQGRARISDAGEGVLRRRGLQRGRRVGRQDAAHQVGVAIDQPGHDGVTGEIDDARAGGRAGGPGLDRLDAVAPDHDQPIAQHIAAPDID